MREQVLWRKAETRDWPAIQRTHAETEQLLGKPMELPTMDEARITLWMVAEVDGKVIGSFYLEKALELCFTGVDPRLTPTLLPTGLAVLRTTGEAGIRYVHCLVPKQRSLPERLRGMFSRFGFRATGDDYALFTAALEGHRG